MSDSQIRPEIKSMSDLELVVMRSECKKHKEDEEFVREIDAELKNRSRKK